MRKYLVGALGGLVALVGFAGAANASATIDLIWAGSGTATTSSVASSATITLQVVLTAGPLGTYGGSVAVDYSGVAGLTYVSSVGGPYPGGTPLNGTDTGTSVTGLGVLNFATLGAAGTSGVLGTIVFHQSIALSAGTLTADASPPEGILNGSFADATPTINAANISAIPEPGTVSLLAMGLGGLALVGRRRA